jgi:hypothetical protein
LWRHRSYAADNSIGSTIEDRRSQGLLTRVELGHIRIRLGWERLHQVTRIILVAQPADVIIANVRTAKQPYAIAMMDGCGGPFERDAAVWLAVIQTTMAILAVVIASRLYQWLGIWAK